jgi:thioester reductase-like protein
MNLESTASSGNRILVTGSNGFVGAKVVETLLEYGFANFRCFVRPSSRLGRLKEAFARFPAGATLELFSGDLLSRDDCRAATDGILC